MGLLDFFRKRPSMRDAQPEGSTETSSQVARDAAGGANPREPSETPRPSNPTSRPTTNVVTKDEIIKIQRAGDVDRLAALLSHGQSDIREAAAEALCAVADQRALPQLLQALRDQTWLVRRYAAEAIATVGDPSALDALRNAKTDRLLDDRSGVVARVAQAAIDRIEAGSQDSSALGDILMRRWADPSPGSEATAAAAMLFSCSGAFPECPAEPIASAVLHLTEGGGLFGPEVLCNVSLLSLSGKIRDAAARGLKGRATPRIMDAYAQACHYTGAVNKLARSDWILPRNAADALAAVGDPSGLTAVNGLLTELRGLQPASGMITNAGGLVVQAAQAQSVNDVFLAACRALGALSGQEAIPVLERYRSEAESRGSTSVAEGLAAILQTLRG
jgi:HEAT repeat protein